MRNTLSRLLRYMCVPLALALATLVAVPAMADKVTTKDGKTYEGEIIRQADSFVTIRVKEGDKEIDKTIFMSQVDTIVRDDDAASAEAPKSEAPAKPAAAAAAPGAPAEPKARKTGAGATKIAFITLGDTRGGKDMVGPYMNAEALQRSIKILTELPEDEQPSIVVLLVDSGGGALLEIDRLVRTIHYELKPKYRTVAWIRSAISAAAMTSWACEEIYMMTNAPIGACTGWFGALQKVEGKDLAQVLKDMEDVSRWGKHEPLVMRAMQICEPDFPRNDLTADIDADGTVTWYDGNQGEHMVCRKEDILTLNSLDAVKFKVARGVADTKDQLAKLLGCTEWVEVGQEADKLQVAFRDNIKLAETKFNELYQKIQIAMQFAQGAATDQERNAQVGRALNFLREMRGMVRKSPALAEYYGYSMRVLDQIEEQIKALRAR